MTSDARTDTLYFQLREQSDRFAMAVIATGNEAEQFLDTESDGDPYRYGVTYTGPEVTEFSQSPYSGTGRLASRFTREL
ncbi:hypothetical protein [Pseudomonas sp. 2FE]|uniref:hypothetical protein n=1 Tax=Pseudomonas sp. 2FE TaxID=2502190 RepID=UPI0010F81C63|nr:hypothetical protein [Pseudomonas sp. 2FE]